MTNVINHIFYSETSNEVIGLPPSPHWLQFGSVNFPSPVRMRTMARTQAAASSRGFSGYLKFAASHTELPRPARRDRCGLKLSLLHPKLNICNDEVSSLWLHQLPPISDSCLNIKTPSHPPSLPRTGDDFHLSKNHFSVVSFTFVNTFRELK